MVFRVLAFVVLLVGVMAHAQRTSVFGDWREPSGSIVEVYRCGEKVCLRIAEVSSQAAARADHHNPDKAQRTRTLCGLNIGWEFRLKDEAHAEDGQLYDPKDGGSYRGLMWLEDGKLHVHGYLHFKAMGRTEVWEPAEATPVCKV